ncbi:hypothetical protein LWI29_006218 [Acer saccharum]|uniref:CCHC-type domain-containing protein n=1 Tax=Acer saccharum TaxID=4024 RepID=A0AA39W2E2_ACESA|nr:hypothetical protein LWI29_006218 [Acer saccharum]
MEESTVAQSIQVMNQDLIHLERFDGENFTRWQEKVKFFLTAFHLAHILADDLETIPEEKADDSKELKEKRKKHKEEDYLCRGHILNALGHTVYNAYRNIGTAKELWTALDNKYRIEEASNQKFLIGNFMDYKMSDSKSIMTQVHELLNVISDLKVAGVNLDESFLVGVIISKLPSSWNGYKKKLKHDEKKHTLESIQRHLRIEEDSRIRESKDEQTDFMSKANAVEDGKSNNYLGPKNTNQFKNHHQNKKKNQKKIKGNCYYCQKPGHMARDCRKRKKNIQNQGNQVNMTDDKYVATVCDANSVDIESGWWLDTGATIHICKDRSLFKTYEKTEDGNEVKVANNFRSKVVGKGTVEFSFTSGKTLTLVNVLHVPDMCKNLISGDLLNKRGFKLVYESDKFVLSKNGTFIGQGYSCNGMIKLNLINNISSV